MNAQDILDETPTGEIWTKDKFLEKFYPEVFKQKQAELNLSLVVGK